MMILALDVGNSSIAAALIENGVVRSRGRLLTPHDGEDIPVTDLLSGFFRDRGIDLSSCGAVISSVVPSAVPSLKAGIETLTGCAPLVLNVSLEYGFSMEHVDISTVGIDRLCDLAGARHLYGAPVMVYDLGTCSTMSVLDRDGVFRGGLISPGIQLGLDAEAEHTALLPKLCAGEVSSIVGPDTMSAMQGGAVIGAAAMIEGIADRVAHDLSVPDLPLVLTGGYSHLVLPWIRRHVFYEPDLVMKGMEFVYLKNHEKI